VLLANNNKLNMYWLSTTDYQISVGIEYRGTPIQIDRRLRLILGCSSSSSSSMAPQSVRSAYDRVSSATFSMVSHKMGGQNLLSRASPCFGRHVKPLIPVAFAVVSTRSNFKEGWPQAGGRSWIFNTTWWKLCRTDLTLWEKGREKKKICTQMFVLCGNWTFDLLRNR
jgi:hypothetical protein